MATTPHALCALLAQRRFAFTDEKSLQDGIARALAEEGIAFEREVVLGARDRIDFLVEGAIGVEVKIGGATSALHAQLGRYAESDRIASLVVVTSRLRIAADLPGAIVGKRIHSLHLAASAFA